ncbi:MAG: L-histidine N(alpha)-methyltransferase [Legionella longbeachae]|nr:L-histidine N(alpha)-methyltransferase [Legionella longbeachae]
MRGQLQENQSFNHLCNNQFALDVRTGLSQEKKYISSKYFYDEKGSELFNQITQHPDYYLTQCELEILENNKLELSQLVQNEDFNLIELGPGEGVKTLILLEQLLKDSRKFTYFTIDISLKFLNDLTSKLLKLLPTLNIQSIYKDFNEGLRSLNLHPDKRNVVLFLGSSIGNYNELETKNFLNSIWQNLNDGDYFLVGFDLRKDINVLFDAYDDSDGITKAFNLNLLERINRELGANFQINNFKHYATYNVYSGAMESYLISTKKQDVYIKDLKQTFNFYEYEPIYFECSHKYRYFQIEQFAKNSNFKILKNFEDFKKYFALSLWQVQK